MHHARLINFFSNRHFVISISGALLVLFIAWVYALSVFNAIPDRIVLHVNNYGEIDMLGSHGEVYGILGAWTLFILLDIYIAYVVSIRKPLWARIFIYGIIPIALLSLLFVRILVALNA